ncbi:hypothetical protein Tco_1039824 [Tanacetum coccineum]
MLTLKQKRKYEATNPKFEFYNGERMSIGADHPIVCAVGTFAIASFNKAFKKTYSRNPKPKAAVKLQSSYADIKLHPSDDDDENEEDENQSGGIRRLNMKEMANEKNPEISVTDKETKKT